MSVIQRLVQPFSDLVRWGEPWDVEADDPLDDGMPTRHADAVNVCR
jgi:hypothetical protein